MIARDTLLSRIRGQVDTIFVIPTPDIELPFPKGHSPLTQDGDS